MDRIRNEDCFYKWKINELELELELDVSKTAQLHGKEQWWSGGGEAVIALA